MFAARLTLKEIGDAAAGAYFSETAQWDRENAEYWLWGVAADHDSYQYTSEQLMITATRVVAELTAAREYSHRPVEIHISRS